MRCSVLLLQPCAGILQLVQRGLARTYSAFVLCLQHFAGTLLLRFFYLPHVWNCGQPLPTTAVIRARIGVFFQCRRFVCGSLALARASRPPKSATICLRHLFLACLIGLPGR
jgi:hypothetical protein